MMREMIVMTMKMKIMTKIANKRKRRRKKRNTTKTLQGAENDLK